MRNLISKIDPLLIVLACAAALFIVSCLKEGR